MSALNLLQYNVGHRPDRMRELLARPGIQEFDVIAIQEPAYNSYTGGMHCPRSSYFWPIYWNGEKHKPRAALLVNKRIPNSDWAEQWFGDDVVAIDIHRDIGWQRVISAYIPTKYSPVGESQEKTLGRLQEALDAGEEVVVAGDFNLHHSLWGGDRVKQADDLAENLIRLMESKGLSLATPAGTITWRNTGSAGTTIDLVFLTEGPQNRLLQCKLWDDTEAFEDHTAIRTVIEGISVQKDRFRRSWKDADPEAVLADSQALWIPASLTSRDALDRYAEYVQSTVEELANRHSKTVVIGKGGKSWWSTAVQRAVDGYKDALRRRDRPDRVVEARRERNRTIRRAQTSSFREAVYRALGDPKGMWKLARWGRESSHLPPQPPRVPTLVTTRGVQANTFEEKTQALREQFFPHLEAADLSDILDETPPSRRDTREEYPALRVIDEEVTAIIAALPNDKAPGISGVPNRFLKLMGQPLVKALRVITQGCLDWEHHPSVFKLARTIALKKPGKPDYQIPKAWRPIALLEVVSKVIEAVIGSHLRRLAEEHGLLPDRQMGARKGRSTETALALLLSQIRAAWEAPGAVATVLSLDMLGAFDRVIRERLIHVLRSKIIPRSIYGWVNSFMTDRRTTLAFDDQETKGFGLPGGVP